MTEVRTKSYPAEDLCITLFERYLSQQGGVPVTVVGRPDRDGSGPVVARRCDALLEAPGRRWSVEHTSIDSFPQQRMLEARFIGFTDPLKHSLEPRVGCWVEILIDQTAIPPRRGWTATRAGLEAFDIDRALATRHSALNALASLLPLCEPGIDDVYLIEAHRGHPGPPAVTWLELGDRIAERCQPAWPTAPGYPIRPRSSR